MVSASQFTFRDLAEIVFRREERETGYFCMIYQCFLDDSADQTQSQIFISAGFLGLTEDWDSLRKDWDHCLRENNLAYYKTSEWKSLGGQFEQFRQYEKPAGRERANAVRDALLAVAKKYEGIRGIGVAIPVPIYKQISLRPEAKDIFDVHPYRRALDGVLRETLNIIESMPEHHMVAFIHDDDDEAKFDELRRYYKEYMAINDRHSRHAFDALVPMDDKKHPPLQLADALANFGMGCGVEWLQTAKQTESETFNIERLGVWDEHFMLGLLKRELKRRGRPIPSDLQSF